MLGNNNYHYSYNNGKYNTRRQSFDSKTFVQNGGDVRENH